MNNLRLVITGNPGVGKHTSAKIIAEKMGTSIIDINEVAINNNAIEKETDQGLEIDVKKLVRLLAKHLEVKKDLVLVGHLAPYVLKPAGISLVAVLRRSPYELEKTFKKRGYGTDKLRENLGSEILGISLYDSLKTFGRRKVAEFDTTGKTPKQTADEVLDALYKKPKLVGIDWLTLVSEKDDLNKFFSH
ncbi:MAG: AAA family ATPase [Thermoproteota archaeon]|nr:AAA family ATPase [Thermoproteota archaeon]